METTSLLESTTPRKEAAGARELDYALNVVLVYQDQQTRSWAEEVCARVERVVGRQSVRSSWLSIHELHQPELLADAVAKATCSDVIVVAVRAADELPLGFFLWADAWLPHCAPESGALVALLGLPERPYAQSERTRHYLMALSRRGRRDFLVQERKLPAASARPAAESQGNRSPRPALVASGGPQEEYHPYQRQWGINE